MILSSKNILGETVKNTELCKTVRGLNLIILTYDDSVSSNNIFYAALIHDEYMDKMRDIMDKLYSDSKIRFLDEGKSYHVFSLKLENKKNLRINNIRLYEFSNKFDFSNLIIECNTYRYGEEDEFTTKLTLIPEYLHFRNTYNTALWLWSSDYKKNEYCYFRTLGSIEWFIDVKNISVCKPEEFLRETSALECIKKGFLRNMYTQFSESLKNLNISKTKFMESKVFMTDNIEKYLNEELDVIFGKYFKWLDNLANKYKSKEEAKKLVSSKETKTEDYSSIVDAKYEKLLEKEFFKIDTMIKTAIEAFGSYLIITPDMLFEKGEYKDYVIDTIFRYLSRHYSRINGLTTSLSENDKCLTIYWLNS